MSDSELSEASTTPAPPDTELERALRREVIKATKAGAEYTVRSIRTAAEQKLGLRETWFKDHAIWNAKSKQIIHDQIDTHPDVPTSPVESKKKTAISSQSASPLPVKRPSKPANGPAKKKQKTENDELSDTVSSLSSPLSSVTESEESTKKTKKTAKTSKPKSDRPAGRQKPVKQKVASPIARTKPDSEDGQNGNDSEDDTKDNSESELSDVIDEDPKLKKKRKSKESTDRKQSRSKATKSKSNTIADEDPDQAEIKRLQGWLVKCGIRKVWGRELKPYETPKAKIKHLKEMLSEAGMSGRYSAEKANQIKEARELAADIEAVQEGAERWGADSGEEDGESDRKPARRLVRGSKNYDFLSSDGEETD